MVFFVRILSLVFSICLVFITSYLFSDEIPITPFYYNRYDQRDCEIALCCVFKNEAQWLKEWIEFHKLIGIKHFYLYNNSSIDHYIRVLAPYIINGEVELYNYPKDENFNRKDQSVIYNHAVKLALGHNVWLAIIDTDEFIVPLSTPDLSTYLKQIPEKYGGIELLWQHFGTSGVKSLKKGELLVEKLMRRAPTDWWGNDMQKSIVRPELVEEVGSPHYCNYTFGFPAKRVNVLTDESINEIRLHHYSWRTENYFYKVKYPRIAKWTKHQLQGVSAVELLNTTNMVEDRSMERFIPDLRAKVFPPKKSGKNHHRGKRG